MEAMKTSADTGWFEHDRFGMFIHWGLYALAAQHEWWMQSARMTNAEYERKYFQRFDPDLYNPELWADVAAKAGGTLARAVMAARGADAVIFCGGLSHLDDTEGGDRFDLRLPSRQDDLIEALAEANPNLVVVLLGAGCVEMPWLDRVKAVVQAWYPGQEGGHAIADVLCGDVCPSGRLPVSWPRCLADTPVARYGDYAAGQETYREGLMVGYRHYDTNAVEPLFPFGYGLSYTQFAWSDMGVEKASGPEGDLMRVHCTVRNTGRRAGAEVVQCYIAACGSAVPRPVKELKAFQKVFLKPGESARVTMDLDRRAFSYWAPSGGWVMESGRYRILLAASAADVRVEQEWVMG